MISCNFDDIELGVFCFYEMVQEPDEIIPNYYCSRIDGATIIEKTDIIYFVKNKSKDIVEIKYNYNYKAIFQNDFL